MVPRSPLLLCDSVQTQTSPLPAQKWEVQIMLHDTKTPTVVLVIFPRQEQEQSLHQMCQKQEEGYQMTLESKCQMTKENKSTETYFCCFVWVCLSGLFFYFNIAKETAQKEKKNPQAKSMLETKSHSELRSMEVPSSCGHRKDGSVVPL